MYGGNIRRGKARKRGTLVLKWGGKRAPESEKERAPDFNSRFKVETEKPLYMYPLKYKAGVKPEIEKDEDGGGE